MLLCVCMCASVCACLKTVCMWHHTGGREGERDEGGLGAAADVCV